MLLTIHGAPIEGKRVVFHQQLDEQDCMACHTDHRGLTTAHGQSRFSLDLLRANLREQCVTCHVQNDYQTFPCYGEEGEGREN